MVEFNESDGRHDHFTRSELAMIEVLRKRAAWLSKRIEESKSDLTFDKSERTALQWAIGYILEKRTKPRQ